MCGIDNYPAGAYYDPNAPWNEPYVPCEEFDILARFTITKSCSVSTNDYVPCYDEEDGNTWCDTSQTDWSSAYSETYANPIELIKELKAYVEKDIATYEERGEKVPYKLKALMSSCEDWELEDESYEQE